MIPSQILDFLKTQRIGVLSVEMPDSSPHGATVHFANSEDPLVFYYETNKESIKARAILGKDKVRASFVVGVTEGEMRTLQMDGEIEKLTPDQEETYDQVYKEKFPEKKEKFKSDSLISFKFTPSWWRYTDWTGPEKLILMSD